MRFGSRSKKLTDKKTALTPKPDIEKFFQQKS